MAIVATAKHIAKSAARKATQAAMYPPKLREALAKGVARQHERDDAESEESDGRHEKQDPPKIQMVVRKWIEKSNR